MANDIFKTDHFAIQVVSTGEFLDDDPGFRGATYTVQTFTIRLNHVAMTEWFDANNTDWLEDDETWAAWHPNENRKAFQTTQKNRKDAFEKKIAEALHIDRSAGSFCVTQAVSEIFSVVHMHRNEATPA